MARLLHLRDLPEADLLHRLQTLCNAHQEFTLLSHKYEGTSPAATPCPRFSSIGDHHISGLPSVTGGGGVGGGCGNERRNRVGSGRRSVSPAPNSRRFDDFHDDHFEDEFDFGKKY